MRTCAPSAAARARRPRCRGREAPGRGAAAGAGRRAGASRSHGARAARRAGHPAHPAGQAATEAHADFPRDRRRRSGPRAAERSSARGTESAPLLDSRPSRDADCLRARAIACLDDIPHELARGRRDPVGRGRAQALLARGGCAGRRQPPGRARVVAARSHVACARRSHLRALSHRPRARGACDHDCPRAPRPDRDVDCRGSARLRAR